ncbi:hypothetical protein Tco_1346086 [Tanacetum coccineum]
MYPRFISVFLDTQRKNVPVPLDHFHINALTSKILLSWFKKGKHFSGNVTPLFDSMLLQPTEDEGDTLERQSEPQPIPSPPHLSEDQHKTHTDPSPIPLPTTHFPDSIPEGSGGNHGGQSYRDRSLSGNKGGMTLQSIKKLKKKAKPVITYHKAWMKTVSMKQRLAGKKSLKKQWMQKESISKQGRKPAKAEPTIHKDPAFDELDDDTIDYMETEDAQDMGRTSYVMHEEKESAEKRNEGTVDQNEGRSATQTAPTTTTPTISGDDETIAQVLIIMKDITEAENKFKQLARDEEVARKVQEDWEAEEVKKLAEEEATKAALFNEYGFI